MQEELEFQANLDHLENCGPAYITIARPYLKKHKTKKAPLKYPETKFHGMNS